MIYHHCARCGRRILTGAGCPCMAQVNRERGRRYDATKRNKEHTAFYASKAWLKLRDACRDTYAHLDIYALYEHGVMRPGRIAHHIIPLEDDESKSLMLDNLIYVSDSSHQEIHKAYSAGKTEKAEMQRKLKDFQKRWKMSATAALETENTAPGGG